MSETKKSEVVSFKDATAKFREKIQEKIKFLEESGSPKYTIVLCEELFAEFLAVVAGLQRQLRQLLVEKRPHAKKEIINQQEVRYYFDAEETEKYFQDLKRVFGEQQEG